MLSLKHSATCILSVPRSLTCSVEGTVPTCSFADWEPFQFSAAGLTEKTLSSKERNVRFYYSIMR